MGQCHALLGLFGYVPIDEAYDKALAASKRAIALDDRVAEAHVGLGLAAMMKWNWSVGWIGAAAGHTVESEPFRCPPRIRGLFGQHRQAG